MTVKNRRINNPGQIKALLQEQVNTLRQDEELDKIQRARTIAYLSNIALSAYNYGEVDKRLKNIEKQLEGIEQ